MRNVVGKYRISSCLLTLLWIPALSMAEEVVELEELRVVASPIIEGNLTDRYAGQKTQVSEEQIDKLNVQDLTAALRKTPGVNISRYNPIGAFGGGEGGAVFIRGMGSSRPGSEIKTYIDDIPMYMGIWNHPLMDLMPIDTARSVDVYKSPQPQNFGNAMAAVNMMPKVRTGQGALSKTEIAAGSFNTVIARGETGGRFDRTDYYIGGGYRHSDGHRDHAEGETGNVFARLGYELNDRWSGYFFGLHSDNSSEDPGAQGADPSEREGTYETRSALACVTIQNTFENAKGHFKLYRNAGRGDWLDQPATAEGVTEDLFNNFEFYGIKARESFGLWETMEVVAGFDWEHTAGDYEKYFSDGTADHWRGHGVSMGSPYMAVSLEFGSTEGLQVTPSMGVRYYDNSDFGTEWSTHAGVVMGYGPITGHIGYSRGVVFPGLDVVVFSEEVIPVLGDSWMDLDPEIMDHYEAGLSYAVGDAAEVDVVWFCNDGRNRYVFVTSPTSMPTYDNVENYTTRGVEVSANIYPTPNLAVFMGGAYMRTDPSDTPYAPEITLSAGLAWQFMGAFTFSADAQYSDDMFVSSQARRATAVNTAVVDSYSVLNAKLSYAFTCRSGGLSGTIFIAGENLTDTAYEYKPDYPMPGLNGMAGLTLIF